MLSERFRTSLTRQVAILAGPLVLQNLSHTLLGVVDTLFVSRIGTDSLAAVGLASVIYFAVLVLFRDTANSTVVFVGRAHGEGNDARVGQAVWRGLNMVALLSTVVIVLPWLFSLLMRVAAPADSPAVRDLGTAYLQIRSFEIPFLMFGGVVWGFLVGRGDSRTPMMIAWMTVLLNILFDWVLVLGNLGFPRLGVTGAAYATLTANSLSALFSAAVLWRRSNRARFATGRFYRATGAQLRNSLRVGVPMGLGGFIEISSFSAFFALIARLGTDILAASQIALQFMSIAFTLGIAVSMAASSLVAQFLGARQPEMAEKAGYRAVYLAMASMALIGLSYLIAPETLMRIFTEEASVIAAGVLILRIASFYQVFDAIGIVLAGALNGAGDTTFTAVTKMILGWGVFIPLTWVAIFPLDGGIGGAWGAAIVYLGLLAVVFLWRFRSGRWKTIQLS